MDINYVSSSYSDAVTVAGVELLSGPGSLCGFLANPKTFGTDAVLTITDGSGGSTLLTVNLGQLSNSPNVSRGNMFMRFPGNGIRFDSSLWATSPNGDGKVNSITVFHT